jgi:hypothetical protein
MNRVKAKAGMMQGFWKLKVTADIGNKRIGHYGTLNQSDQPAQFGHVSQLDPSHQK